MSISIKFKNIFGEEISEQQKNSLMEYLKAYYDNGVLIKEEMFVEENLDSTTYQIASTNDVNAVLLIDPSAAFELNYVYGNHTILEELDYSNGILVHKRIYVSDQNDDVICVRNFKLNSQGIEIKNFTEKKFYENAEERYTFEYKSDGSCLRIYDNIYDQNDIHGEDVGNQLITSFTWVGFEYYQFADPIIPGGGIA